MNITTKRLTIRRFQLTDLADYLAYQSHPEVRRFMPGQAMTDEQAERLLAKQSAMQDLDRDVYHAFAVTLRNDERLIGDVGMYLPSGDEKVGDLGFQFDPEFHGQGYAFEAAEALLKAAFSDWNLTTITASCDRENVRSSRLLERLGMRRREQTTTDGSLAFELKR